LLIFKVYKDNLYKKLKKKRNYQNNFLIDFQILHKKSYVMNNVLKSNLVFFFKFINLKNNFSFFFLKKLFFLKKKMKLSLYSNKVLNVLFKSGLKLKYKNILDDVFKKFFLFFLNKNNEFFINSIYTSDFYFFFKKHNLFNKNIFLNIIITFIKPLFTLKVKKVSKKKIKKKYQFELYKIQKEKRDLISLKWFVFEILKKKTGKLLNKILITLIDILIFQKNSNFLKKKLKIYRKVFNKYMITNG
jgi:hypothetical protein